jgi:hypothetical protein
LHHRGLTPTLRSSADLHGLDATGAFAMNPSRPFTLAAVLCVALAGAGCGKHDDATETAAPTPAAAPQKRAPAPEPTSVLPVDSGKSFAEMDANHDGSLTLDELGPTEMLNMHFVIADTDSDNKLSPDEVATHREQMTRQ